MSPAPHLFVALSGHGFGHLAQAAPVLNALRRRLPALRLTVQSPLSGEILQARIAGELTHIPEATDLGMIMASALEVKTAESLAAYRAFHADWEDPPCPANGTAQGACAGFTVRQYSLSAAGRRRPGGDSGGGAVLFELGRYP